MIKSFVEGFLLVWNIDFFKSFFGEGTFELCGLIFGLFSMSFLLMLFCSILYDFFNKRGGR